jgi:hypothetical protein
MRVIAALSKKSGALVAPLVDSTRKGNPTIDAVLEHDLIETQKHAAAHFRTMTALPTARVVELDKDPLAFVRTHGARRARAEVPLNAVLQAYRTGHKGFWVAISEIINQLTTNSDDALRTTMLLSDYCIEYTDLISVAVADAYVAEESRLASQRTRLSLAVVENLLRGDSPQAGEGADLCERAGIGDHRPMVVAIARRPAGSQYTIEERSALAHRIGAVLAAPNFARLIELRLNEIVVIVSCAVTPGARVAQALHDGLGELDRGAASGAKIGVGLDVQSIAELPRSYEEAVTAIAVARTERIVVHLAEIAVDTYLRHKADETALRLTPPWAKTLAGSNLVGTLQAFAACSLNVKACAAALKVHNNTVYHRLDRVQKLTGVDPRTYAGLSQLLCALSLSGPLRGLS